MTTLALDPVSLARGLCQIETERLGLCSWRATNSVQEGFLAWYMKHRELVQSLEGCKAEASLEPTILNAFLEHYGLAQRFNGCEGIGIASVYDIKAQWLGYATADVIRTGGADHPAFMFGSESADFFEVSGFDQPVVRLGGRAGYSCWLVMTREPATLMELLETAQRIVASKKLRTNKWLDVKVPLFDIDTQPDLSWMIGANTDSPASGHQRVARAVQLFRLRMDESSARVESGSGTEVAWADMIEFDRPFIGFFTDSETGDIPLATFYAGTDCWLRPEDVPSM